MARVLRCTGRYNLVEVKCGQIPVTLRVWKNVCLTEVKVDTNFAKANGYKSVPDMFKNGTGARELARLFGGIPEWLEMTDEGSYSLPAMGRGNRSDKW